MFRRKIKLKNDVLIKINDKKNYLHTAALN